MTVIPVLNIFYPPSLSLWIMALVDLPANIYLIPSAKRYANARIWLPLTLGTLLTMAFGVYILVLVDATVMQRIICAAIIVACLILLSGWLYRGRLGTASWTFVGAVSGLVLGATLIAVVTTTFLNAASRDTRQNRANIIVWAFATGAVMVALLSYQDIADAKHFPIIAIMAVSYIVGCIAGTSFQNKSNVQSARRLTLILIILIASSSLVSSFKVTG